MWAIALEVKKKKKTKTGRGGGRRGKHSPPSARWNVVHFVKGTCVFWGQKMWEWTETPPWSSINLESVGRGVEGERLIYISRRQMDLSGLHYGINLKGQKGM